MADTSPSRVSSKHRPNVKVYPLTALRKPQHVGEIGRAGGEALELHHVFGTDISRRDNIHFIDADTVIYSLGNAVVFENITCAIRDYLLCVDEGGVGCVCVHPSKKLFAVGGRGCMPKIYIYSYPDKEVRIVSHYWSRRFHN
jgi:hypothetical protein